MRSKHVRTAERAMQAPKPNSVSAERRVLEKQAPGGGERRQSLKKQTKRRRRKKKEMVPKLAREILWEKRQPVGNLGWEKKGNAGKALEKSCARKLGLSGWTKTWKGRGSGQEGLPNRQTAPEGHKRRQGGLIEDLAKEVDPSRGRAAASTIDARGKAVRSGRGHQNGLEIGEERKRSKIGWGEKKSGP